MKQLSIVLSLFILSSCIPLRIAPTIKEDKIMIGKKFKRNLPRNYALIFEDPKDADEFYNFINTKYALAHEDVGWNVPITINNEEVYLSYYETEIPTKTINLFPIFVDVSLASNGNDPILEDFEFSRRGHWYVALTVSDANMEDCLDPAHLQRINAISYLRNLRIEYLNTHNYLEARLKTE